MSAQPRVVSVNVGTPTTTLWRGREVTSAIWKSPVEGRVPVAGVNLSGDNQADRTVHGGPDKAVYSYPSEHAADWRADGFAIEPGGVGENLVTDGGSERDVHISISSSSVSRRLTQVPSTTSSVPKGSSGAPTSGALGLSAIMPTPPGGARP